MTLHLYDPAGAEPDRRFSPYCWRIRLALAHKGLAVETIPWRFIEKADIARSAQKAVPVLVDDDRWIADSWTIVNYLEDRFPQAPSLFGGAIGRSQTRLYSSLADGLVSAIFPLVALDILRHIAEKDCTYFRESREKRVGMALEDFVADRDKKLPAFRASLVPMRTTLKAQPFFGGEQPTQSSDHFSGPGASADSPFWKRTIRSSCGAIGCLIASTVWHVMLWPVTSNLQSPPAMR